MGIEVRANDARLAEFLVCVKFRLTLRDKNGNLLEKVVGIKIRFFSRRVSRG